MTTKLYHVIVRNDKTNTDLYLTKTPETHDDAVRILSKQRLTTRSWLRHMLIESTNRTDKYAIHGKGPSPNRKRR